MASSTDELMLLERVFLRIGSAETDEQLENAVQKFLPPVLLKLSSQQEGVRKKVMELLVHINKRVKSRPLVKLPVESLLTQYQDPSASNFVTNFTIIYIKMGFPRLEFNKQVELVPSIINSLENKPTQHTDSLLLLIIPLLGDVTMPTDPTKRSSMFGLNEKPTVAKQLLSIMLDCLLLPYSSANISTAEMTANVCAPPGMSSQGFARVTEVPLKPEELEKIKLGIVKFLSGGVLPDADILIHLIVAASDTRFSVANLADLELKKIIGGLDWGLATLATPIYKLYLGTQGNVKPEVKKTPANTRIRLKLLHFLCRVTGQGFLIAPAVQVIFDSLYGTNTNTKLKSLALQFTTNIIQMAELESLKPVGRLLQTGLLKLTNEGEPIHQGQAYIILGLLGRRLPDLFENDLGILENLFKKLATENPDIRLQIREGMLNLTNAYKFKASNNDADSSKMLLLHSLLSQYITSEECIVRFVATRFMCVVFPEHHVASRYLLLLCTGDSKDEVSNEAIKTLYGHFNKQEGYIESEKDHKLPNFDELCSYIFKNSQERVEKNKTYTFGNHVLPFLPHVFKEILVYLRLCLIQNLNVSKNREILKHPNEYSPIIGRYLDEKYSKTTEIDQNALIQYLLLIKKFLSCQQHLETILILLEIIGPCPSFSKLFLDDIKLFRDLLNNSKEEIREYGSILLGILVVENFSDVEFENYVKELCFDGKNRQLEGIQGCILGTASCLERKLIKMRESFTDCSDFELFKTVFQQIFSHLCDKNSMIVSASCYSLGLLGRCAPLPVPNGPQNEDVTKLKVVEKLLEIVKMVSLQSRVREKAVRSLGLVTVGEVFPHSEMVALGLIDTAKESKEIELHFGIGETLVMLCQSIWSPEARDVWRVLPGDYAPQGSMAEGPPGEIVALVLDKLLQISRQPHPNSRQASAIWLLSLVKNLSGREEIKSKFQEIQQCFMDFLSDSNELVVDVASKGLGLVFESCENDLSSNLLEQLVGQLSSGRKTVQTVTKDTKLFEEGELGQSPTGGSLSTYKELCSLASDLNKPDLIYKFMQLANHNTVWNSKKGAAFGFLTISQKAGEQLKQYLPLIIPKLYRYQFDPNLGLQNSMQRIWHTLVPETQKTIDEYHNEILEDLIENLTSSQWRVRQSCCLALSDLFRAGGIKSVHQSCSKWAEIWQKVFRVMDDYHEQTRTQANNTANVLSKLCIRACDSDFGKDGTKILEEILPVFLETGIVNTVAEVRQISLQTVSQLVNAAGVQLKPFLHLLIPALLQATGELESTKLVYISNLFGGNSSTQEAIDSVRASVAKSHYTTETMTRCLQYVDATILDNLIPKVLDIMKTSPNLGSRVACAHFLTLLQHQLRLELQPYAGKCLTVLISGVLDRNTAIRKCYAGCIGHIIGSAKESSIIKVLTKIKTWYFEKEDENIRFSCALCLQSIGTHNQDVLKNNSEIILPLIFFAMHEENVQNKEIWTDIWLENSPGTELGIKNNISNICELLKTALESPSWNMKSQAANAISTVANKLEANLNQEHRDLLLNILVSSLSGRIFTGKHKILTALSNILCHSKGGVPNSNEIIAHFMRECKKDDLVYKKIALESLGDVLSTLKLDYFEELYQIVQNILESDTVTVTNDSDDELSNEEMSKKRENLIKLRESVYETLGKAWPENISTQEKYGQLFVQHCVNCLSTTTRSVQVSVIVALCSFVDKLLIFSPNSSETLNKLFPTIYDNILKALEYSLSINKHTKLRKEALNVVLSLAKSFRDAKRQTEFEVLRHKFTEWLPSFDGDNTPEIKSRVIDLKDLFKK